MQNKLMAETPPKLMLQIVSKVLKIDNKDFQDDIIPYLEKMYKMVCKDKDPEWVASMFRQCLRQGNSINKVRAKARGSSFLIELGRTGAEECQKYQ